MTFDEDMKIPNINSFSTISLKIALQERIYMYYVQSISLHEKSPLNLL